MKQKLQLMHQQMQEQMTQQMQEHMRQQAQQQAQTHPSQAQPAVQSPALLPQSPWAFAPAQSAAAAGPGLIMSLLQADNLRHSQVRDAEARHNFQLQLLGAFYSPR